MTFGDIVEGFVAAELGSADDDYVMQILLPFLEVLVTELCKTQGANPFVDAAVIVVDRMCADDTDFVMLSTSGQAARVARVWRWTCHLFSCVKRNERKTWSNAKRKEEMCRFSSLMQTTSGNLPLCYLRGKS